MPPRPSIVSGTVQQRQVTEEHHRAVVSQCQSLEREHGKGQHFITIGPVCGIPDRQSFETVHHDDHEDGFHDGRRDLTAERLG